MILCATATPAQQVRVLRLQNEPSDPDAPGLQVLQWKQFLGMWEDVIMCSIYFQTA